MQIKLRFGLISAMVLIGLTPLGGITITESYAQGLLPVKEVLSVAKSLQIPQAAYRAKIIQTVTTAPRPHAHQAGAAAQASFQVDTSLAEFVPGEGLKRTPLDDSDASPARPPVLMNVNLGRLLDKLMSSPDTKVELVDFEGRPNYLVSGQFEQGATEVLVWLDHEYNRVRRVEIAINGKPFAETEFEYAQRVAEYWLPQAVHIHHYTDDSRIVLQFANYTF
jgi:hypothetical protein